MEYKAPYFYIGHTIPYPDWKNIRTLPGQHKAESSHSARPSNNVHSVQKHYQVCDSGPPGEIGMVLKTNHC